MSICLLRLAWLQQLLLPLYRSHRPRRIVLLFVSALSNRTCNRIGDLVSESINYIIIRAFRVRPRIGFGCQCQFSTISRVLIYIFRYIPWTECGIAGVNTYSLELLQSEVRDNSSDTSQTQQEILCKGLQQE